MNDKKTEAGRKMKENKIGRNKVNKSILLQTLVFNDYTKTTHVLENKTVEETHRRRIKKDMIYRLGKKQHRLNI